MQRFLDGGGLLGLNLKECFEISRVSKGSSIYCKTAIHAKGAQALLVCPDVCRAHPHP